PFTMKQDESIIQYVYIDPASQPEQILLQFYTDLGDGEHRVYWGNSKIQTGGVEGTPSLYRMGSLPQAGQWVRLKISPSTIGLAGKPIKGMLFATYNGRAYWDKTTSAPYYDTQTETTKTVDVSVGDDSTDTTIKYTLLKSATVQLDVYDFSGALVKNIFSGFMSSGSYENTWDQKNTLGNFVSDGDYYFRFASTAPIDSESIVHLSTGDFTIDFSTIAYDVNGNKYEIEGNTITKRTQYGYLLTQFGSDKLLSPTGLAIDSSGDMYVQDTVGKHKFLVGARKIEIKNIVANIRIPAEGSLVRATVPIFGVATAKNFKDYKVEYGKGFNPSTWTAIVVSQTEMLDNYVIPSGQQTIYGNLATWETGMVPGEEYPLNDIFHPAVDLGISGKYTVRLTVNSYTGQTKSQDVHLIVGRVINNGTGGIIASDDGKVKVTVPPLALQNDWDLFAIVGQDTGTPDIPSGYNLIGNIYDFKPTDYTFRRPCTLEFAYTPSDLGAGNEDRLGLYRYEPVEKKWVLISTRRDVILSEGDLVASILIDDNFTEFSKYKCYYAILEDTTKPQPPVIYQPPSPTNQKLLTVSGRTESSATVDMFVNYSSTYTTIANTTGDFVFRNVLLSTGTNSLYGVATDVSGYSSDASSSVTVNVLLSEPTNVYKISFKQSNFIIDETANLNRGEKVYVELTGLDASTSTVDRSYCVLFSSYSDPVGIKLQLTETGVNTGVYRGSALIGSETDVQNLVLAAGIQGEQVKVVSETDSSKYDILYIEDLTAPSPPDVWSTSHLSAVQNTFETGLGEFSKLSDIGAEVMLTTESKSTGEYSVRIKQVVEKGDFSVKLKSSGFDAKQYPIISFDYKIPAGVKTNIFVIRGNVWNEIVFTDTAKNLPPTYTTIGSVSPTADNNWHNMEFNLYNLLKQKYPNDTEFVVDLIVIGDWDSGLFWSVTPGNNTVGSTMYIDNFFVKTPGSNNPNPVFEWSSAVDASGIAGYSYVLDQSSNTVPDEISEGAQTSTMFINKGEGIWYFHIRSVDGAGNWSKTNRCAIKIDTQGPTVSNPYPENGVRESANEVQLKITDAGGSGVNPETIKVSINGTVYDYSSGGISYNTQTGTMTFRFADVKPAPVVIFDGGVVNVSLTEAKDFVGNGISSVYSWWWIADYSRFSGSDVSLLTINGAEQPCWSRDSSKIAFVSERDGNKDIWTMDSSNYAELISTSIYKVTTSTFAETEPSFSHDGAKIAYIKEGDIWLINADGTNPVQISSGTETDSHPVWSSDSTKIVFARSSSGLGNLWQMNINTVNWTKTGETQLTSDDIGYNFDPQFSFDDAKITYRRSLYVDNVWVMNSNGTEKRQLTASNYDFAPAFSYKNDRIIFDTKRTGGISSVWISDITGENQKLLIDNHATWPETDPVWSPDGSRIAFTSTRNGSKNVWVLSLLEVTEVATSTAIFSPNGDGICDTADIKYNLSVGETTVNIEIYNSVNVLVRTLLSSEVQSVGSKAIPWDGRNNSGNICGDGVYTYKITALGKSATEPVIKQGTVKIDNSAPSTTLTATAPLNTALSSGSTYYVKAQTVFSLAATDGSGIGLDYTYYSWDKGVTWNTYTGGNFTLPISSGYATIQYKSVDKLINYEQPKEVFLLVDNKSPITDIFVGGTTYYTESAKYITPQTYFVLSSTDDITSVVSGVKEIKYVKDGGNYIYQSGSITFTTGGAHTFSYYATDNVDNNETSHQYNVFVDTVPPTPAISLSPSPFFNGISSYTTTSTTYTLTGTDTASGTDKIYYKIDGSSFTLYTSPFTIISESEHTIYYKAKDNLGNESGISSFKFITDNSAPTVKIQPDGLIYVYGTTNYAPVSTRYILSSSTNVTQIEYSVNGSSFVVYTGSITLTDAGLNTIDFKALKNGIYEDTATYKVVVDTAPPQTVSSILGWQYSGESLFIGATSQIKLEAAESGQLPSGLKTTRYAVDDGTVAVVYVSPFNLSSTGEHSVKYWSTDNVENTESTNTLTVVFDNVSPTSQIAYSTECGKSYISSGKTYLSGDVYFAVSSTETVSGLNRIEYAIDSANYTTYTGTFNITADGWHTIYYRGVDNVENKEPAKSYTIITDKTPPAITVTLQGNFYASGGVNYANSDTRFVFIAPDNLSGTNRIEVSVDSGTYNSIVGYITLSAEGPHTLEYYAVDNLNNQTNPPLVHNVTIDNTVPSTDFFVSGSSYTTGQTVYISSGSLIGFNATDTASGVKETKYKIDSGYWTSYSTGTGFSVTPGLHTITYYSTDNLLNKETEIQKNFYLDGTAPATTLTTSEQPFDNGVNLFMSDSSSITLTASDIGCGVSNIYYAIDSSSFTEYTEPFMISTAGFHNVYYYAVDHLNNSESTKVFEIVIDSTPPSAKITPSVDLYISNGVNYASATVTYSLRSLNTTSFMVNVDSSGYVVYTDAISLATEGLHTIAFYGIVNGINEDESIFEIYVDIGKPSVLLGFSGPQYSTGNKVYTSSSTLYLLTAEDSATMVNTGIEYAEYGIDTSGWLMITSLPVYQKQLNIFPTEGDHTVRYRTSDNVGNITESSTTISVDKTPPAIALLPDGSPYIANGKNYVSGNMKFSITGTDTGSGVNSIECKIDTGSYTVYQNTFTVNIAGDHVIYYRASDNIGNATEIKSYGIFVDTVPPSVSIAVSGKSYTNSQSINFALPDTQFSFSGADNIAFDRVEYNPDDNGYRAYSTPVTFISEGLHNLRYKSADKVGNWSAEKSYSVTIDTTPPGTTVDILDFSMIEDGKTYVGPQTRYVFLSTDAASGVYITNYKIDNGSWNPLTENSVMLNLVSGEHLISYYSVDRVDNTEPAKSFTVYVDTIPPAAPQGVTALAINDTDVELTWTANTESDLAGYNIYRAGVKISTYIVTLTTYTDSGLSPKEYGWQVSAVDKLGNESVVSSTVSLVVGKLPCLVSLTLPEKYSLATGTITITGTAAGLHFSQYEIEYGQGTEPASWTNITTSTNPVESGSLTQWDTFAVSDGLYTVKLKAKNTVDVITETNTVVSVDNTVPTVDISSLVANSYIRQTVEIRGTAYDVNFSSYKVEYSSTTNFTLIAESTITVTNGTLALWDTLQLPDSVYTLKLTAFDKISLLSQTTISVNVDNSTPTASIISPSENQEIFGTINIIGIATANNFKEYVLEYGKGSTPSAWTTITTSTNPVISGTLGTLDTVGLKGTYTLRIKVKNLAEGEAVATVAVNIKPQLIITELNPQDAYHDWVEIYCTTGTIDISGYILSNLNTGTHSQLATSSITITQGEYAVIHWKAGTDETDSTGDINGNGYIDLYIPDTPLSSADDQLCLMKDNKIVDAVIWTNNDGSMSSDEVDNANYLVSRNEWTGTFSQSDQSSAVVIGSEKQSIGRSFSTAVDIDSKNDWSIIQTPNPGKNNSISVPNIIHIPVTVSTAGTNIEITAEITDTDGISSATLYYKITGSGTFLQASMSASSNTYTATIPSNSVTTSGVDYYIKATDNSSNSSSNPLFAPLSIYYVSVNPAPSSAKIIVNEIMYDPSTAEPGTEWIEIYNAGETSVDISSWTVGDTTTTTGAYEGIYTFSTGTVLTAHQYLVLARSNEAANGNYDLIYGGNSQGNIALTNTGDQVFVRDNNGFIIDSVDYVSSWGGSNGTGPNNNSLERKNPLGTTQDSANWASSSVSSGTPKSVNSVTIKPVISNVLVAPSVFSPNGDELFDSTTIYYSVSQDVSVAIKVYDSGDTLVKTLLDNVFKSSGTHNEIWDGKNSSGYYVATGTYTIKIDAVNSGAITANTVSVNVKVDNTLPSAGISSPQYNQIYGHFVTISGTATDANFNGYTIKFGTGSAPYEWSTVLSSTNPAVNGLLGTWNTGALNGTYSIKLDAKDSVENVYSSAVTIKIDNTAPVTNISPVPALYNQYVSSWTKYGLSAYDPVVSDVSAGISLTEYKIDSGNFTTYTTSITLTTGGSRTITYRSKDVVNNTETDKTFNVCVDTISPVTTVTVYGDYYNDGVNNYGTYGSSVVFTSSDTLSGAKETWVSVDNGSWGLYTSPIKFTTEGTHSVKYYSKDNVGNTEKIRTYLITVDDTFPIVNISNPLSGSYIRQTVEIKGVIVDPNLKRYYIEVGQGNNPASWTRIYTSGLTDINTATYNQLIAIYGVGPVITDILISSRPFHNWQEVKDVLWVGPVRLREIQDNTLLTISKDGLILYWDTTQHPDGIYTLKIVAEDKSGHIEEERQTNITIDNTQPTASISIPAPNSYIQGNVRIAGTAKDTNFSYYKLSQGKGASPSSWNLLIQSQIPVDSKTFTYWNSAQSDDGPRSFRLQVYDKAGNDIDYRTTAYLDNTLPVIVISTPVANQVVKGLVTVSGTTADMYFDHYVLRVNTSDVYTSTVSVTNGYLGAWNTTSYADGQYDLYLIAWDKIGHQGSTYVTVNVDNPPAISNVSATNIEPRKATINWTTNEPADSRVEYGTSTSYGFSKYDAALVTNHCLTLTDLSPGTTYHYFVKSKDSANQETQSGDYTFTTLLEATSVQLSLTSTGDNTVTISWTSSQPGSYPIDSYKVYRATFTEAISSKTLIASTTQLSYTDTGLVNLTTYYYQVVALDTGGFGSLPSNEVAGMPQDTVAPSAITDLMSYAGPYSGEAVLLWTATGDNEASGTATSYDIRYRLNSPITTEDDFNSSSQVTGDPTPAVSGTEQWMTITGLTANNTYYFAMKAVDDAGLSSNLSNSPSAYLYYEGSPVRINEVVAARPPSEGSDAIEFYVTRYGNYGGYKLYELANWMGCELVETFPTTGDWANPISSGTYIILHLMEGTDETIIGSDNIVHIYSTESGGQTGLIKTDNVLLLSDSGGIAFSNGVYQSGTIVDAVAWANQDTVNFTGESGNQFEQFSAAINAAVNQSQWNKEHSGIVQIDTPNSRALTSTKSLARTEGASDTSPSKTEWSIRNTITLGTVNGSSTALPGRGTASISSSTVVAGSTISLTITYTAETNDLDDSGHMVVIIIPDNWTQPQTTSSNTAGYVTTNYSIESGWALSVSSREIIVPVANMLSGGSIAIEYKNAIVQPSSGTAAFTVKADDRGTNIGELTSGSPIVNVVFRPETITNLSASSGPNTGEITLTWSAPDPKDGTDASNSYDIRYASYAVITDEIFTSATQITNELSPQSKGINQSFVITGLTENTTYYFAIKSSNDYNVWSELSNSAFAIAQKDIFAPNSITDLKAMRGYQQGEINLSWTSPGDDGTVGTASTYIVRYSTTGSIDSGDWSSATDIIGEPTPLVSGTQQSMAVTGLTPGGIYYFAMKSQDDAQNISTVSNCSSATARPSNIADYLVISEICVGTTGSTLEYVELYNPTTYPITVQGNIKLKMTTGTSDALQNKTITWINSTIPTHGFFLFASTNTIGNVSADAKYSAGITGSDGVMITNVSDVVIDKVAWGNDSTGDIPTCTENTRVSSTTALATGNSIERKANVNSTASSMLPGGADYLSGNGFDTENNNNDFVVHIGTYNPQNSGFCEGSPAFWARLDPTEITIQPGQHKEINVVITNFDDEDCFFDLSLNTALPSTYYAMPKTVKVKAGDTNSTKINIHIPANVSLPEDTMYPVTVQVKHLCKPSHHERHNPENVYMVWTNGEVLIKGDTDERTRTIRMVASTGGGIYNKKSAQVTIHNGTMAEDAEFQIIEEDKTNSSEEIAKNNSKQEQGLVEVGAGFEFEPSSVQFNNNVVITLPYDTVLSSQSYVYYVCSWDKVEKNWKMMPTVEMDEDSKQVSCNAKHFSLYKVFAKPVRIQAILSSKVEADPAFVKGEIYSFPNPAKRGKCPTLHIECGVADKVEIRIYNIAAELVDSTELYGTPQTIRNKYAYEYNWDISDIASGVYIYVIRAKKSGYGDIKATGKAAIIK
ncbi:MAG: lamin tail domain-containing protein, partial [Elusimicrobia bacterium]|nr:lamin tail domain-containing protein [Elusimicrobiota bacterium]